MDFLVERPPREVLDRTEIYLWRRGFRVSLRERTEATSLFFRMHVPTRGFLKRLLNAFVGAPAPVQRIRLMASEAGEGRTRLTVIETSEGEGPDEWGDIEAEIERRVFEELRGAYWPL